MRSINIENSRQNSIKVFSSLKETSLEEITRCTMMLKFANPSSLDSRELSNWNKGQESFSNASKSQPFWKKEAFPQPGVFVIKYYCTWYMVVRLQGCTDPGGDRPGQRKALSAEKGAL